MGISSSLNLEKRHFELKGKNAEEAVQELAYKSFLREWCYPNPKGEGGKEICDLLVVFDDTMIIAQVKDIRFTGNDERYIREAFRKPTKQLLGAERRLFSVQENITLSNALGYAHNFNPNQIKRVFRIVVSVGDGDVPFNLLCEIKGKLIHTFDRSLQTILNELDTISDFRKYLSDKESLHTGSAQIQIIAEREIDLLADYLYNGKSFDYLDDLHMISYMEGIWEQLVSQPQYTRKQKANRISYFWDRLIDFAHECPEPEYRDIARELSRLNRFQRRCLSQAFIQAHDKADYAASQGRCFRRTWPTEECTYVFVFSPRDTQRKQRLAQLQNVCVVARDVYKQNSKVLGIATVSDWQVPFSFDFVLLDFPEWTGENQALAKQFQTEYGILTNTEKTLVSFEEYPRS